MTKRPYVPSHERRRQREVSQLELENAELRRRLSAMYAALVQADAALADCLQWEAYVRSAFEQSTRAGLGFFKKHAHVKHLTGTTLTAEQAHHTRKSAYIADRLYAKEKFDDQTN